MGLATFKDLLAVIGGLALIFSPLVAAWITQRVHKAVPSAPSYIELAGRVTNTESWLREHSEDVKAIPRLSDALERLEKTLDRLLRRLGE